MPSLFFKKNLFNTKEGQKALGYLEKRKISEEIIQKLKIGYAMNSWDALLSYFQGKNISPGVLEKAGLVLRRQKKRVIMTGLEGELFSLYSLRLAKFLPLVEEQ